MWLERDTLNKWNGDAGGWSMFDGFAQTPSDTRHTHTHDYRAHRNGPENRKLNYYRQLSPNYNDLSLLLTHLQSTWTSRSNRSGFTVYDTIKLLGSPVWLLNDLNTGTYCTWRHLSSPPHLIWKSCLCARAKNGFQYCMVEITETEHGRARKYEY